MIAFGMGKKIVNMYNNKEAVIFALSGQLGSGKTTFAQGFAKGLGVAEVVLSPTFVIMKSYVVLMGGRRLYHIDCYRIHGIEDLVELGWENIVQDPNNIVLLEWSERIRHSLPDSTIAIDFRVIEQGKRTLTITEP